jgi:hypothetical protein
MITILNTLNAKTRDQALHIIINQMTESLIYIPLAYKLEESRCSCCRSEYFNLICKVNNEYKILRYNGYIKHKLDCALIRCSCNEPFTWSNINPKEEPNENLVFLFKSYTSIIDNGWYDDYTYFVEQQQENMNICKYNEEIETDVSEKNWAFYFG